jgi:hypothetical protein
LGIFLPGVALFASARLAQPSSPWARRFYTVAKLDRSHDRASPHQRRYTRVRHRFYDVIGGAPHLGRHADHTRS